MSKTDTSLCNVLMAAFSKDAAEAPDWVHLVPATNGVVVTNGLPGFVVRFPDERQRAIDLGDVAQVEVNTKLPLPSPLLKQSPQPQP